MQSKEDPRAGRKAGGAGDGRGRTRLGRFSHELLHWGHWDYGSGRGTLLLLSLGGGGAGGDGGSPSISDCAADDD